MEIKIFDVEHGFCGLVIADNGNSILIDCGHNESTGFRPHQYLRKIGQSSVESLIISNYDEDHLSDLPFLIRNTSIGTLYRNKSLSGSILRQLKQMNGPLASGMLALLEMIGNYTADIVSPPEFSVIQLFHYHNSYPDFDDTNNLSLVTFLDYKNIHIIFPGDMETAGWKALLGDSDFIKHLMGVNVFIASHHGRKSGFCSEVFDLIKPDIIIISDESIRYDTQENIYNSNHCKGIAWNNTEVRYIISTRSDGMITITDLPGHQYWITTTK